MYPKDTPTNYTTTSQPTQQPVAHTDADTHQKKRSTTGVAQDSRKKNGKSGRGSLDREAAETTSTISYVLIILPYLKSKIHMYISAQT